MARMRPIPVQPHIEDPMAMLLACHDKVRHFSQLLHKLVAHVASHGADQQARDAAHAVWRYFEIAAPLHHADEDQDLYPALQALSDAQLSAHCQRLTLEHGPQHDDWRLVSAWLRSVAEGAAGPPPPDVLRFANASIRHAHEEERCIYPAVQRLGAEQLSRIAASMSERRGAALATTPHQPSAARA